MSRCDIKLIHKKGSAESSRNCRLKFYVLLDAYIYCCASAFSIYFLNQPAMWRSEGIRFSADDELSFVAQWWYETPLLVNVQSSRFRSLPGESGVTDIDFLWWPVGQFKSQLVLSRQAMTDVMRILTANMCLVACRNFAVFAVPTFMKKRFAVCVAQGGHNVLPFPKWLDKSGLADLAGKIRGMLHQPLIAVQCLIRCSPSQSLWASGWQFEGGIRLHRLAHGLSNMLHT